jgi:C2HE / C2H2 / C2HC zinc-binding finger/Scavenger mRNA decapping enzyme C-term binding
MHVCVLPCVRLGLSIDPRLVTKLMSPQGSQTKSKPTGSSTHRRPWMPFDPRDGLGEYLRLPEHPLLLYSNDFGVAISDLYPKALVHKLFIPRNEAKMFQHPFDALADSAFRATLMEHIAELKRVVTRELRNRLGTFSAAEQPRRLAMEEAAAAPPGKDPELPPGRDWENELLVGVHSGPSMNHLHVHVLSPDHFSQSMRHRKHYNSFATPFLVRLEEFPLAPNDPRRAPDRGGWLKQDLTCWRCGKNFKNRFGELKLHLEKEFDEWKRI